MTFSDRKILLLGHKGLLGSEVFNYFSLNGFEVITTDLRWPSQDLKTLIENFEGFIINCAGAIPQNSPKDYSINYEIPLYIQSLRKRLIQPCTDCVFSGRKNKGQFYGKYDNLDGVGEYSLSKIKFLSESSYLYDELKQNTRVIRTSIIGFDRNEVSLLSWFLKKAKIEGTCKGYKNHYWNGMTTLQWSKIALNKIMNWENRDFLTQVGTDPISKLDLLNFISDVFEVPCEIIPHVSEKSSNKCLESDLQILDIKTQLEELREFHRIVK